MVAGITLGVKHTLRGMFNLFIFSEFETKSTKNLCVSYPPVKVISLASKAVPSVILNNPENVHFLCVFVCVIVVSLSLQNEGLTMMMFSFFPGNETNIRKMCFRFFRRRRNRIFQSIGFALDKHQRQRESAFSQG